MPGEGVGQAAISEPAYSDQKEERGRLWVMLKDPENSRQKRAQEEKSEVQRKKLKIEEVEAKKVGLKGKRKRKSKAKVPDVANDDNEFT
ncbi:hypothetical protein C0995_010013 [Termitomyces sp. Mi166|nr:hypothetical protein C0995_010013 [Termitomyces sp. Mi166\